MKRARHFAAFAALLYPQLAEQYDLVYEGELIAELVRSPELKSDSVHMNREGYQVMAERIYELLKDNGAL